MEALNVHNMTVDVKDDEVNVVDDALTGDNDDDEEVEQPATSTANKPDEQEGNDEGGVPTQVLGSSSHRKDKPMGLHSRKRGESIFEDSAWTEEYDAQGRIDGTLVLVWRYQRS